MSVRVFRSLWYVPAIYTVVEVSGKGVTVVSREGKLYVRHKDDIKVSHIKEGPKRERRKTVEEELDWLDPVGKPQNQLEKGKEEQTEVRSQAIGEEVEMEREEVRNEASEEEAGGGGNLRRSSRNRVPPRRFEEYET